MKSLFLFEDIFADIIVKLICRTVGSLQGNNDLGLIIDLTPRFYQKLYTHVSLIYSLFNIFYICNRCETTISHLNSTKNVTIVKRKQNSFWICLLNYSIFSL